MWPFSDPDIAKREFQRLVVRVPHPMGDQIMATPAVEGLRMRYPDAHITLHGNKVASSIYKGLPWVDDFLVSEKQAGVREVADQLKAGDHDACILLSGSLRSAIPPYLAGIPHRIGYRRSGRTPLLTAHRKRPRPGGKKAPYPTKRQYFDLIAMVGAPEGGRVRMEVMDDDRAASDAWLARNGIDKIDRLVPFCVGAAYGPTKQWPTEHFAALADRLVDEFDAVPILLCAPNEVEIGRAIQAKAQRPLINTGDDPLNIDTLKALIGRCRLMVSNDTGPRHIAGALQVPIVVMLGAFSSEYTDTDLESQIVLGNPEQPSCWPCESKKCRTPGFPCMTGLLPDLVFDAVAGMWE
ncbi:MAG: lipopolysaccharide heptosyltransferase II [Planctomycetota bacterium]|jgi:heptosyltransferase-2